MQLGDKEARTAKKWESAQLGLSSSTASKFWAEATSSHWTQISRKLQQSWIWPRGDVIYLLAVLLCSSLWSTQRTLEVLKDLQKLFQEGLLLEVCGGFHVYVCRVCVCVWLIFYLLDSALFSPRMWTWRNGCQMCPKNISIFPVLKRNWIFWGS